MRNAGASRLKAGGFLPSLKETEGDVGERVCAFLRGMYPEKTAANVCADTAISPKTIENWLSGAAAPRSIHFIRLYCRYGPEFLVAVTNNPPAWLTAASAAAERAQLEAERARIEARLARCPA